MDKVIADPTYKQSPIKLSTHTEKAWITGLSHDGRGIAQVNGKIVFVFGALIGEEVIFSYTAKRAKYDEARVVEVINPSSERAHPECPFFGQCGGCSLQHMSQVNQINHKQSVLLEQLQHFGHVSPESLLAPLQADPYGYRRKARYSVRYVAKKQRVLIGFRELHNPRFCAEIDACRVLHPAIGNLIAPLQECLSSLENKRHIAQIEAALGDNATALIFRHLEDLTETDRRALVDFAEKNKIWLFLQPRGYDSIHKAFPLDSDNYLTYEISDSLKLYFNPADFTQINASINRRMIQQAVGLLKLSPHDRALDLFCGIGNFSLPIAQRCAHVIGVESDKSMVQRASMNAERNYIKNASFLRADLSNAESIRSLSHQPFTKLLIDPPRSGARAVVEELPLSGIKTIVYVSCNPATLARDAGILAQRGFRLSHAGVMDMFTHTEHVEAMAAFDNINL